MKLVDGDYSKFKWVKMRGGFSPDGGKFKSHFSWTKKLGEIFLVCRYKDEIIKVN